MQNKHNYNVNNNNNKEENTNSDKRALYTLWCVIINSKLAFSF